MTESPCHDEIHISPSGDIQLTIGGMPIDCTLESDWYTDDWQGIAAQAAAEHGYRIVGDWADVTDPGTFFHGCRAFIEPVSA